MQTTKEKIDTAFSGSIPANYDAYLGPMFFEPFALRTAARAGTLRPNSVLELACGTGRLTRHLTRTLGSETAITATDINPAMLQFAKGSLAAAPVQWDVVDAVDLPYSDEQFDLVVIQFGVMFYSDRSKAYREALRVLRPGGRMLFITWSSIDKNPAAQITQELVKEFFPIDTPAFYEVPFSYHDRELMREEILLSGFERVVLEEVQETGSAKSAENAASGLLEGSPIHTEIMARNAASFPEMHKTLTERFAKRFGSRDLQVPLSAWMVEAIKG